MNKRVEYRLAMLSWQDRMEMLEDIYVAMADMFEEYADVDETCDDIENADLKAIKQRVNSFIPHYTMGTSETDYLMYDNIFHTLTKLRSLGISKTVILSLLPQWFKFETCDVSRKIPSFFNPMTEEMLANAMSVMGNVDMPDFIARIDSAHTPFAEMMKTMKEPLDRDSFNSIVKEYFFLELPSIRKDVLELFGKLFKLYAVSKTYLPGCFKLAKI